MLSDEFGVVGLWWGVGTVTGAAGEGARVEQGRFQTIINFISDKSFEVHEAPAVLPGLLPPSNLSSLN